jgi:hypothetical protein
MNIKSRMKYKKVEYNIKKSNENIKKSNEIIHKKVVMFHKKVKKSNEIKNLFKNNYIFFIKKIFIFFLRINLSFF